MSDIKLDVNKPIKGETNYDWKDQINCKQFT